MHVLDSQINVQCCQISWIDVHWVCKILADCQIVGCLILLLFLIYLFIIFIANGVFLGEEIVAGDDLYGGTDRLLSKVIPKKGIVVKLVFLPLFFILVQLQLILNIITHCLQCAGE